jgi:hypothetical protein
MKNILSIITLGMFLSLSSFAQNGKASTTKKTFSRETSVSKEINADESKIWSLITNAADYPRWNSTVTFIEGKLHWEGK